MIMFQMTEMTDLFIDQIQIQYNYIRINLRSFAILNFLDDKQIAQLATYGVSST